MEPYDRANVDHRLQLTTLRVEAIKQIITLSLALVTIPAALAGIGLLPRPNTSAGTTFWVLTALGMAFAVFSALSGIIFLTSAPNWVKDPTQRESTLDGSYVIAPLLMIIAAMLLVVAAFLAFFHGAPSSTSAT